MIDLTYTIENMKRWGKYPFMFHEEGSPNQLLRVIMSSPRWLEDGR